MRYAETADERDARRAVLEAERRRIDRAPAGEETEPAGLYRDRGLSPQLARAVAAELSASPAPWSAPSRSACSRCW
jgi:vacuolar iron transporter family protein